MRKKMGDPEKVSSFIHRSSVMLESSVKWSAALGRAAGPVLFTWA